MAFLSLPILAGALEFSEFLLLARCQDNKST